MSKGNGPAGMVAAGAPCALREEETAGMAYFFPYSL